MLIHGRDMDRGQWVDNAPRALGGFSVGGGLTLQVAIAHPHAYGLWLLLAAGFPEESLQRDAAALAKAGPIVQYCGAEDSGLVGRNRALATRLRDVGADAVFVKSRTTVRRRRAR